MTKRPPPPAKPVPIYERQPQWESLDARRFVEEGIAGQDMPTQDTPTGDAAFHPMSGVWREMMRNRPELAGSIPRTKGSKSEFKAGHV